MKKAAILFVAAALLSGITSCKKEEQHKPPIQETLNIELKANEAYTFTLPRNKRNDSYEITSQAAHYSISTVGEDASGNRIYQYTPATDYTGTDAVVIANPKEEEDHHGNCAGKPHLLPPPHDKCDGPEDHYIVTINFTIDHTATTAAR
ncbi:MAG: hypothetical protein ACJ77K_17145 [Bacteroidia bacterium]